MSTGDSGFAAAKHFEHTQGPGSRLDFKETRHAFALYSVAHAHSPPVTDGKDPALRILGCFSSAAAAQAHAKKVMKSDPGASLFLAPTHEWTLACSSLKNAVDSSHTKEKISKFLKRHEIEKSVSKAKFEQHQEDLRNRSDEADAAKAANEMEEAVQKKMRELDEKEAEEAEKKEEDEDFVRVEEVALTSDCKVLNQEVVVISIIIDKEEMQKNGDAPEFLFRVYRCCKSEDEADGFVRNVASRRVVDHDLHAIDVGEWVRPLTDVKHQRKKYRDSRLDSIMNSDNKDDKLDEVKADMAAESADGTLV